MSGMNRYVPSEELIRYGPAQSRSTVDHPCMVDLIKLVMMYGPVPSNYKIIFFHTKRPKTRIGEWRLAYMEIPTNVRITHHPCSPSGVQAREPIGREFSDDREDDIAVFHPALPPYKAGRLLFTEHDDWYTAIAAGLASVGIKDNGEGITAEVVESIHNRLEEQATDDPNWTLQRKLYHRADRGTMVFKNEPEMARVAKFFGQDLVVLCPPIPDDGSCWDHFWNAVNRPPLRFRHGPGEQCRNQFIVVACFPKFSSNSQDVHWLTVAPNNDFKITWDSYLKRNRNFRELRSGFGWPEKLSTEKLIWTIVAAHRTYVNGRLPPGTDLGRWIHQYGKYINESGRAKTFKLDTAMVYTGRRIDATELGAWILSNNATLKYLRLWEDANDAHMTWMLDRSAENLATFKRKEAAACKLP